MRDVAKCVRVPVCSVNVCRQVCVSVMRERDESKMCVAGVKGAYRERESACNERYEWHEIVAVRCGTTTQCAVQCVRGECSKSMRVMTRHPRCVCGNVHGSHQREREATTWCPSRKEEMSRRCTWRCVRRESTNVKGTNLKRELESVKKC